MSDVQAYNVNLTENIKAFIGISFLDNEKVEESKQNREEEVSNTVEAPEITSEEIVPNEEEASSLNQMEETISKIKELVLFQKPINEGTITSRFGTRQSENKNVSGYHTGIDIGAVKRNFNLCCNISEQ